VPSVSPLRPPEGRARTAVLEPVERLAEVLFGLIMVLGFTGSLSAAEAGRAEIRTMLFGALGCNLAWGLIDGIMYLMFCLGERSAGRRITLAVRGAASPGQAHEVIAGALPPVVAAALRPEDLERVRAHLAGPVELPGRPRLRARDWWGALGVLLLVFLSTFPVVLPFLFMQDALPALRVSNAVAIGLLFLTGYAFGRASDLPRWGTGAAMVVIGLVLVAITMALGG
jgi:hypothetical protein